MNDDHDLPSDSVPPYTEQEALDSVTSAYSQAPRDPYLDDPPADGVIVNADIQEGEMVARALDLLAARNDPPTLFEYGGRLARVRTDGDGVDRIELLDPDRCRTALAARLNFFTEKVTDDGIVLKAAKVPSWLARSVLAADRGDHFPTLRGVITAPTILPDGTIVATPGYDPGSRLWYAPGDLGPIDVPEEPSSAQVTAAAALLLDWLGEFAWADDASGALAIAFALTCAFPDAFTGRSPLFLIDANQPGVGKTLLAAVVHLLATGRAPTATPTNRDEELEKRLTAAINSGRTALAFDNLDKPVRSPVLAEFVTSTCWLGRRLNHTEIIEADNRITMSLNGNNISVGGDLPRRCAWIKLRADQYQAWKRPFHRPDLPGWTLDHRPELIAALLTLLRAWHEAGRPVAPGAPTLGSFQSWADTMGGALAHAGIDGFLTNTDDANATGDEDDPKWAALLTLIESTWTSNGGWFSTAQFTGDIQVVLRDLGGDAPELPKALAYDLAFDGGQVSTSRVGSAFKAVLNRPFDDTGIRLDSVMDPGTKTQRWRVIRDTPA